LEQIFFCRTIRAHAENTTMDKVGKVVGRTQGEARLVEFEIGVFLLGGFVTSFLGSGGGGGGREGGREGRMPVGDPRGRGVGGGWEWWRGRGKLEG